MLRTVREQAIWISSACCIGIVAIIAGVSGCGLASDEDQIRDVVGTFNEAAANDDGGTLCREVLPPIKSAAKIEQCARMLTSVIKRRPENWRPINDVGDIEVDGDSATASGRQQGSGSIPLSFIRTGSDWRFQVFD